jgi:hypothetical protein
MGRALDIERFADAVKRRAASGAWPVCQRAAAVDCLVRALGDDWIRQDADAEDAVCSALETIGIMRRVGNLMFELLPDDELADGDREAVDRWRAWLPRKFQA